LPGWGRRAAADAPGARQQQPQQEQPAAVAVLGTAFGDDTGQRCPLEPPGDEHAVLDDEDVRDGDVGVAGEGGGEGRLRVGLEHVVDLVRQAVAQLGEQRPGVEAGRGQPHQRHEPVEAADVRDQRLRRAGVLHLDRHRGAVLPHRAVHLADARRGHRPVVEGPEQVAPAGGERRVERPVDGGGRHRRRRLLQADERVAVRPGELRRQGGLHRRQRLPDLHRAALELAECAEQLLRRAGLHLRRDRLGRLPAEPAAEADRRPAGVGGGQRGEPGRCAAGVPPSGVRRRRSLLAARPSWQRQLVWCTSCRPCTGVGMPTCRALSCSARYSE
jgi:hypothetical protein